MPRRDGNRARTRPTRAARRRQAASNDRINAGRGRRKRKDPRT